MCNTMEFFSEKMLAVRDEICREKRSITSKKETPSPYVHRVTNIGGVDCEREKWQNRKLIKCVRAETRGSDLPFQPSHLLLSPSWSSCCCSCWKSTSAWEWTYWLILLALSSPHSRNMCNKGHFLRLESQSHQSNWISYVLTIILPWTPIVADEPPSDDWK